MPDALSARVLRALARRYRDGATGLLWAGDARAGLTTGAVAAALALTPGTPERQALNVTLPDLRRRGCLHYELDRLYDREIRWYLTREGLEAAEQLAQSPRSL